VVTAIFPPVVCVASSATTQLLTFATVAATVGSEHVVDEEMTCQEGH